MLWFWIELTTPGDQKIWVDFRSFRMMQRNERNDATHLISYSNNTERQPDVTTVKETPEEILALANKLKKRDAPTGLGFIRHGYDDPSD
jgi:hypothetical protein